MKKSHLIAALGAVVAASGPSQIPKQTIVIDNPYRGREPLLFSETHSADLRPAGEAWLNGINAQTKDSHYVHNNKAKLDKEKRRKTKKLKKASKKRNRNG